MIEYNFRLFAIGRRGVTRRSPYASVDSAHAGFLFARYIWIRMRFYEDISVGDTRHSDGYRISKDEIIEFGEKYDPQPFHTDEAAAEDTVFGGLVASGWQTAAICMRLHVETSRDTATQAGLGVDDLRWHRPLRPDDVLRLRTEILDKRTSEGDPNRGIVTIGYEGLNQDDELVISYEATAMVRRRADE